MNEAIWTLGMSLIAWEELSCKSTGCNYNFSRYAAKQLLQGQMLGPL